MRRSHKTKTPPRPQTLRCAVYTRKSSEEGLEQDFNSLDAQREACEAFIRSQKHEGWICLPEFYDDGGISGGTIERPALQRLLADICQGRVHVVVVYKVDRLTRSLSDFAKIVDIFDARGVSFVSVTQAFNTTIFMGRLNGRFILSLNDRAEVRETFARFRLEPIQTTYTIVGQGRAKRARELLITAGRRG